WACRWGLAPGTRGGPPSPRRSRRGRGPFAWAQVRYSWLSRVAVRAPGRRGAGAPPAEARVEIEERGRRHDESDHHRSRPGSHRPDRKSTRLNSSHDQISYAVFCLKKKKNG